MQERTFISVGFVCIDVRAASPLNTLGRNVFSVETRKKHGTVYLINLLKLMIIQVIEIAASAREQYITPLLSVLRIEASHRTYS